MIDSKDRYGFLKRPIDEPMWKPANDVTTLAVGDQIQANRPGVHITIQAIAVFDVHLGHSTPWIKYAYDDNGRTGTESVTVKNFMDNILQP